MRPLAWALIGLMAWGMAQAAPSSLLDLLPYGARQQVRLGSWPWSDVDSLTYGQVRLRREGSGWAFMFTHILVAKTGKELAVSRGDVKFIGTDFFDLECGPMDTPYCVSDRLIVVDRVYSKKATVEQHKFELPTVPNCTYHDGYVITTTRHSPRYLDYLIEASCGYVFARYDWAGKSNLPIRTQVLKSKTWPLPYPK